MSGASLQSLRRLVTTFRRISLHDTGDIMRFDNSVGPVWRRSHPVTPVFEDNVETFEYERLLWPVDVEQLSHKSFDPGCLQGVRSASNLFKRVSRRRRYNPCGQCGCRLVANRFSLSIALLRLERRDSIIPAMHRSFRSLLRPRHNLAQAGFRT